MKTVLMIFTMYAQPPLPKIGLDTVSHQGRDSLEVVYRILDCRPSHSDGQRMTSDAFCTIKTTHVAWIDMREKAPTITLDKKGRVTHVTPGKIPPGR